MVEQIGHASAALATLDTELSGLASVAVWLWRAGAVKKYEASTAVSTPATAAMRIERIMIVVPSVGCRTVRPATVLLILCLGSLLLHQRCLGFADFHPIGIGVFGHLSKLPEICRGFLRLICGLRRLSCAVQAAQPVGRRHQRSLIFR